ncbi:hypothetical protein Tco_0522863 [Tanacetum coccineum]
MGNAIVKLVKKVKKLEGILKRRNVVLSNSEEEEPEAQGRKSQDDPLASLVQGLVTPSMTKVNASGEEQVEDISPNTLEAAKTLSRVASLKPKSIDKGRRYKRKTKSTKERSTVSEQVSTGRVLKCPIPSPDKGRKRRKAPMIIGKARSKRNKPMTQSQLKTYMMNYLKNQGTWKLSQLKNLSFEEVKEEFDKLVKQPAKKRVLGRVESKMARKGFDTDLDKDDSKDSYEVRDKLILSQDISRDDLTELYRIVMNRYGMDGPEDELEKVFWKYLKNMFEEPLSTDPVLSLLNMQSYASSKLPEGFDKMLWGDLMIMFNQGDTADFWDTQQNWKLISWKLHSSSGVHTIMTSTGLVIHMFVENRYPLAKEVLSNMLELKLETEEESSMALELIKFVKQQLEEFEDSNDDDTVTSAHEEAERV